MLRKSNVAPALGAFAVACTLACGGSGMKTTQKADGQVTTCSYGGKTYNPGDSFRDDCNTCTCGSNGEIACTLVACLTDAGSNPAPDAALPDARADGTLPLDQAKDMKPTIDVVADLSPDLPPATDSAQDALLVPDTAKDSQLVADARDVGGDARQFCIWGGDMVLAIGQSIPTGDGCNICECMATGMVCTGLACVPAPDAPAQVCSLPYALTFGSSGGMVAYQDSYFLDGGTRIVVTRTQIRGFTDGPTVRSCSPTLPACGASGVVSVSTIAQDLTDADIQAAFALTTSHVYGIDSRPVDGSVWSITRASGGKILVGYPCPVPATEWCQGTPPGIQRLADDLKSLAFAAAASSECAGL